MTFKEKIKEKKKYGNIKVMFFRGKKVDSDANNSTAVSQKTNL